MSDSFEFTLHSPLTKEDWNKISDAEHENTMYVTFNTPQGRQVKYIKCEVIDKIRAEIEKIPTNYCGGYIGLDKQEVLQIIDKYRGDRHET